jgi:hypothetical protein
MTHHLRAIPGDADTHGALQLAVTYQAAPVSPQIPAKVIVVVTARIPWSLPAFTAGGQLGAGD